MTQDEINAAIGKSVLGEIQNNSTPNTEVKEPAKEVVNQPTVEVKKEEDKAPEVKTEVKPEKAEDKVSSLNNDIKQPTFEELLAEKTGNKYKNWEELEEILSKPTEKVQDFADEQVAKINEYIKQGGSLDDWMATQSIDFKSLNHAEKLAYKMRLDDPEISDEEVELELRLKYGFDQWKDDESEYDDGKEPEIVRLNKLKFERDAAKAEKALLEHQAKWSVPKKKDTPVAPQLDPKAHENWNNTVDETLKSIEKIPIKISDKDTFEYVLEPSDKKEINKLTKQLYTNVGAMFDEFKDSKSPNGFNIKGIVDMFIKAKTYDKAIALAADHARKVGQEGVVKDIKNIDFKSDGQPKGQASVKSLNEQIGEAILKNNK